MTETWQQAAKRCGWWLLKRSASFPSQMVEDERLCAFKDGFEAGKAQRPEVGAPITQCFTAGAVSSTTEGTRLVCAKCGQQHLMAMGLFDYDLNQHADYPTEHPDRCLKLDGKFYDPPIFEQGKSRPHWRCHKKAGHDSTNGGMHCSTHRDCGARIGDPGDRGICGNEALHDNGIHEAPRSPLAAPAAWVATKGDKVLHLAKADGWRVEVVQTEPQKERQ